MQNLKESVWNNITSVYREGEGKNTINIIQQFHFLYKVKELECSFIKYFKVEEVTASWLRLFHNLIGDGKMNTGEN